jgi:signal transduction histidine kinase
VHLDGPIIEKNFLTIHFPIDQCEAKHHQYVMGTVLRVVAQSASPSSHEGFATWWEQERLQREVERLRAERDALYCERERLMAEKDRLMRLAAAGAQIPVLVHELRKPLSNIAAVLETHLADEVQVSSTFLHALLVEAGRMATMLDTAGATSRELRTRTTQRIDTDLEACRVLLAHVTACHGIDLTWQIEAMPELPFDTQVLRALLCNLVANAIEACGAGDAIEVWAGLEGADFALQVLDTGVGMPPETLARCTDAFFTTKPEGLGIGLALCRELVERAGGRFELASSVGTGTRVQVRVPLTLSRACVG